MKRMRLLAWLLYCGCVDITRSDGSFAIPRTVFRRVVRFDWET